MDWRAESVLLPMKHPMIWTVYRKAMQLRRPRLLWMWTDPENRPLLCKRGHWLRARAMAVGVRSSGWRITVLQKSEGGL